MKIRSYILSLLLLLSAWSVDAQLLGRVDIDLKDLTLPKSQNDSSVIIKSVGDGLFVVKQSYQICDRETGDLFGFRGNKEFGTTYSVGVKVADGFLLTDSALRPWVGDANFAKYAEKYDPIFYQSRFRTLKPDAKYDSLAYDLTKQDQLVDTAVYRFASEAFEKKGFILDTAAGKKEGWIVLVTAGKDADLETAELKYDICRYDIEIKDGSSSFTLKNPNPDQVVLGGIYVVPAYTAIGVMEFRLCGVVAQSGKDWKIYCPFAGVEAGDEVKESADENSDDEASELTPVDKSGKKKSKDKKKKK